ncbi:hypothetical protein DH2020_019253 [Rehmannia glutinosa]|uniref:UBX domain-containing protein n=1 Tax=Rehmannia glutinosa TaxID=99300 RepID=A0ABR0WLA5_REHGL
MSSRMSENEIGTIVRRMVSIPKNILVGISRMMNQGIDLMGIGGRNNHPHPHHQNFHSQQPSNFPFQDPSNFQIQEEWAFLANFEQQYGTMHPFFYACRYMDALKIAQDEHKFMVMYIHSPEHPFTPSFCRETLCSELVVQFLDANFVCWGGLASRGDGLQMATALRVSSFPFCAVVAPVAGDNLAVLQQLSLPLAVPKVSGQGVRGRVGKMEGPMSPAELVEILQRTLEEQGVAFGSGRSNQEEKRRADRRLREEQDVAYVTALQKDQEKERLQKKSSSEVPKPGKHKENSASKQPNKVKPASIGAQNSQKANTSGDFNPFSKRERREHSFLCTDKIQEIYKYIDSLGLVEVENYRLISNFPRKVYGVDQKRMSLKEAGLHPKASLFLELL